MSDIYELAAHLPEGVHWGESITPDIMEEILASVQPSALKEKLRCAEERIAELEQQPRALAELPVGLVATEQQPRAAVPWPRREDITEDMRAGFERLYAEAAARYGRRLEKKADGTYLELKTQEDWNFYQRAWADAMEAAPPPPAVPVEDYEDLCSMPALYCQQQAEQLAALRAKAQAVPAGGVVLDEREAFENWAAGKFELHRHPHCDYSSTITNCAWNAWQARAVLAARPQPLEPGDDIYQRMPAADGQPMRGANIKAGMLHDAGAYARCSYCDRYSDNPKTLSDRPPVCDCGKQHGWSGSFEKPTAESQWAGEQPQPEVVRE